MHILLFKVFIFIIVGENNMLNKIIKFILDCVQVILLILIVLILVFHNFFSSIIILDQKTILIILTGTICLQILNTYLMKNEIIKSINSKKYVKIEENVHDAYNDIFKQVKYIKKLRIYADSSSMEQAYFDSDQQLVIKECILLLRIFDKTHPLYSEKHNDEISSVINKWKMLVENGKIQKMVIIKYDKLSDIYYLIIDDKILATDLHNIDVNSTTLQSTNHSPILVRNNTIEGKEFIKRSIKQIDNYIEYYGSNSENIIYKNY